MAVIAVVGATGTVGRPIVAALGRDGHEVRALSRRAAQYPVDLRTGAGLDAALAGCDVVVDASNGPSSSKAREVLVEGCSRLVAAEARAGVGHHVCVSIVGIDEVPVAYYRVKLEQEGVVQRAGVPWTIARSTQFHDLVGALFSTTARWHLLPAARARVQPVDVSDAAQAVAALAAAPARRRQVTIAGPEVRDLRELARLWARETGRRAVAIPIPLPGALGRALRNGALTCANPDIRGGRTFADWLRTPATPTPQV